MRSDSQAQVWFLRLQVIWIFFTAAYILIGRQSDERIYSSFLLTIGTGIICAIFGHALLDQEAERARSTLLIALASCFFLVEKSLELFRDAGGSFFLTLFGVMCGATLWVEHEKKLRLGLLVRFFVALFYVALCSLTMLGANIAVKHVIKAAFGDSSYYLIAPHTTGVLAGLSLGLLAGLECFHHNGGFSAPKQRLSWFLVNLLIIIDVTSIYQLAANAYRFDRHECDVVVQLIFCAAYSIPYIIFPSLIVIQSFGKKSSISACLLFACPFLIATIAAFVDRSYSLAIGISGLAYEKFFLVELLSATVLTVTVYTGLLCFTPIARAQAASQRGQSDDPNSSESDQRKVTETTAINEPPNISRARGSLIARLLLVFVLGMFLGRSMTNKLGR